MLTKITYLDAKKYNSDRQSSHERPPCKLNKVVVTRAGLLQEGAHISNPIVGKAIEGGCLQKLQ